jgi:hypothetical protein
VPEWGVVCGRRVVCVEEAGLFTAGFFPRLQVVACTALRDQASVWLTRRSISISFHLGCIWIAVLLHEDSRAVDVWVRCSAGSMGDCRERLEEFLVMLELAREKSCLGSKPAVHALHPGDLRGVGASGAWPRVSGTSMEILVQQPPEREVEVGTYGVDGTCDRASLCHVRVCDLLPLQVRCLAGDIHTDCLAFF